MRRIWIMIMGRMIFELKWKSEELKKSGKEEEKSEKKVKKLFKK